MTKSRRTQTDISALLHSLQEQRGDQVDTEDPHNGAVHTGPTLFQENTVPLETYHIYPMGEGLYVTKTPLEEDEPGVVTAIPSFPDAERAPRQPTKERIFVSVVGILALFLLCFNIAQAFYVVFFQSATVSIIAHTHPITTTQTIQLVAGLPTNPNQLQVRRLPAITLSQQTTVAATGTAHQDPTYAVGYITFYNGEFAPVTISAGQILTGANGIQAIITQTAIVPGVDQTANPPALGQATVSAHALHMGAEGNIQAFAINTPCCYASVLAKNTQAFTGGQDARTYTIVTQNDITAPTSSLATSLSQSMQGALTAQTKHNESLFTQPCSPNITADHKAGDQATTVHITATETCSATGYNNEDLQHRVTTLLTQDALRTLGKGYSLIGGIETHITTNTAGQPGITLTVSSHGLWAYLPTEQDQLHIKQVLAGKRIDQAKHLLLLYPGIENIAISGVERSLPSDVARIHLLFIYPQT